MRRALAIGAERRTFTLPSIDPLSSRLASPSPPASAATCRQARLIEASTDELGRPAAAPELREWLRKWRHARSSRVTSKMASRLPLPAPRRHPGPTRQAPPHPGISPTDTTGRVRSCSSLSSTPPASRSPYVSPYHTSAARGERPPQRDPSPALSAPQETAPRAEKGLGFRPPQMGVKEACRGPGDGETASRALGSEQAGAADGHKRPGEKGSAWPGRR